MILYGLTGGIGMGKSTAQTILESHGVPVVDTDLVARELVEPGEPALAEIESFFGAAILDGDGRLRRAELASIVFRDPTLLKKLEEILHPRIRARWEGQVLEWRQAGVNRGVVSIPLLFETGAQAAFDRILCVACSEQTQRQRLRERGWGDVAIGQRISSQMPVSKKIELSNRVIWTEGSLEAHEEQLKRILSADGCGWS